MAYAFAQEGDGHSRRVGQRGRGFTCFHMESTTVYRKSGARGTIHHSFKRVLSLVDGISAEAGSPKSVKLSSRLRSLLTSEESNVLVGPVWSCHTQRRTKTYKNHQSTCQHPPMTLRFLTLCFSGIFVPRSDRPALARAPVRSLWETQKKGESRLATRPTGNPGLNKSGLFGFPRLASIDCFTILQTCWEREGRRARERERERGSLKTQQHPLNLHQSRSVLQAS